VTVISLAWLAFNHFMRSDTILSRLLAMNGRNCMLARLNTQTGCLYYALRPFRNSGVDRAVADVPIENRTSVRDA
jgi:hypothetical protein